MLNAIKVILFDVGNVVIDADQAITYKLLLRLGVPKDRAKLFFSNSEYLEFSRGNITGRDFYKALVEKYLMTALTYEQVIESHNQHIYGVNEDVLEILNVLSRDGVAFATDTNEWQMAREKELVNLKQFGGEIFRSNEIRKIKTDPGYFDNILQRLRVQPTEVLFVDDVQKNIAAATARGLNTLQYQNASQLKSSFVKLGLL